MATTLAGPAEVVDGDTIRLGATVVRLADIDAPEAWGTYAISSVNRSGLKELLEALWAHTERERKAESEEIEEQGDPW